LREPGSYSHNRNACAKSGTFRIGVRRRRCAIVHLEPGMRMTQSLSTSLVLDVAFAAKFGGAPTIGVTGFEPPKLTAGQVHVNPTGRRDRLPAVLPADPTWLTICLAAVGNLQILLICRSAPEVECQEEVSPSGNRRAPSAAPHHDIRPARRGADRTWVRQQKVG
jgi:hypothetical protein